MVRDKLEQLHAAKQYHGKFNFVPHYFGYEGRCSFPSKFDADYCYTLGATAGALLEVPIIESTARVQYLQYTYIIQNRQYYTNKIMCSFMKSGKTGYIASVQNLVALPTQWAVGGTPVTSMMNIERRKGKDKPVIKKKLVDLEDAPFQTFRQYRDSWVVADDYRVPGPIQHSGPTKDDRNLTLILEALARRK